MQIIDTHCHIHDPEFASKYEKTVDHIIQEGKAAGVERFICVGTSAASSREAVAFAESHAMFASLALHPHEVSEKSPEEIDADFAVLQALAAGGNANIVAIGECGLDYYYHKEPEVQAAQKALFRRHLDLATEYDLPLIFHIREAFPDFLAIIDEYTAMGNRIRGVVHSFSAGEAQLKGAIDRGFYIGLNGIMTFTKLDTQLAAAKAIPLDKLLLETDAPFLTPAPFRGKMCELNHIVETARFLSQLRGESLEELAAATTRNAEALFRL